MLSPRGSYTAFGGLADGEGRLTVRKAWIVGGAVVAGGLSFVMVLVVAVYLVAGNLVGGMAASGRALAKGAVPAASAHWPLKK